MNGTHLATLPIMADRPAQDEFDSGGKPTPVNIIRPAWRPGNLVALVRGQPLLLATAALVGVFILLTALILGVGLQPTPWDVAITREIQLLPNLLGEVLVAVSAPGFQPWNFVTLGVVLLPMLIRRWLTGLAFTALAGLGGITSEIVKILVNRPRPTPDLVRVSGELATFSFPSGHVTFYTTLFGFLFYLAYTHLPRGGFYRRVALTITALFVILVGPSRVYMGQHWASDALAGYALGFAYLLALISAYRFWLKRHATP